jgi:hypothetical protein
VNTLTSLLRRLRGNPDQRRRLPYGIIQGYGRSAWPLTVSWHTIALIAVLAWTAFYLLR